MKRIAISMVGLAIAPAALAYEITTHALITSKSYDASVLNPSNPMTIARTLGFDRLDQDYPFWFLGGAANVDYRDEAARTNPEDTIPAFGDNYARAVQQQERDVLQTLVSRGYLSGGSGADVEQQIRSWLLRGAIREDDNDGFKYGIWFTGDKRDDDPFGHLLRAGGHFYDPFHDRAFDYPASCATYGCLRSTLWAMGRTDPLHPPMDTDDTARRNHFTWQDARNNFWWALTLKRDSAADGYDYGDAGRDGSERLVRWATTIKSLGHVVHLLEDAAQPQHVRNDAHAPPGLAGEIPGEGETDAGFEAFTDYRVIRDRAAATQFTFITGNPLRRMAGGELPQTNSLPSINLGGSEIYPGNGATIQFSTAAKFFTTRAVESGCDAGSLRSRRGLADLSNRNFFTSGTMPGFRESPPPHPSECPTPVNPTYPLPINDLSDPSYTRFAVSGGLGLRVGERIVYVAEYAQAVSDAIATGYDTTTLAAYGGKVPLVTESIWEYYLQDELEPFRTELGSTLTYNNMRYMADVMLPRAVGYSAGLINHFFRGRLEVTPIDQDIVAVANQGDPHIVDGSGYVRRLNPPTRTFGFDKIRLRVRNVTEAITESGTSTVVAQTTGGAGSRLVAIAKYHRNECYSQDLTGERVKSYTGVVTEPACASGRVVRSAIQEISVSAALPLTAGELDAATPVEKLFDFSADPIPINATDLFITVAYRGMLGDEADGIALGTYDVSEPTFASFWNNTDYYWNGTNYVQQVAAYPLRNVYSFYVCAGSPSKFLFRYAGASGAVALGIPPQPGQLRLAVIVGRPDNATQRFPVRAVPNMQASPHASLRSSFTRGQYRQASKEIVAPSVLAAPYENCFLNPPPASVDTWCFDPIHKRRGLLAGDIAQPIYWNSSATTGDGPDVDSVPLPAFSSAALRDGGEIRFNDAGALQNCLAQPAAAPEDEWQTELHEIGANTPPRTLPFRHSIV